MGNVAKFAHAPDRQRVEHMTAQVGDAGQGVALGDGNLLTTTNNKYTFSGDEVTNESIRLLLQSTAGSASNQTAAPTQAISIADVEPGKTYRLGYYGITGHALTFGGTSKTEGTDFTLDRNSGLLTILVGGAIVSGDDVAGTVRYRRLPFGGSPAPARTDSLGKWWWSCGTSSARRRRRSSRSPRRISISPATGRSTTRSGPSSMGKSIATRRPRSASARTNPAQVGTRAIGAPPHGARRVSTSCATGWR